MIVFQILLIIDLVTSYRVPNYLRPPCYMQKPVLLDDRLLPDIRRCNSKCASQFQCLSAVFCADPKLCLSISDFTQYKSIPSGCHFSLKVCSGERFLRRRKRSSGNKTVIYKEDNPVGDYIDFGVMVAVLLIIIFTITCLAKAESSGIRELR